MGDILANMGDLYDSVLITDLRSHAYLRGKWQLMAGWGGRVSSSGMWALRGYPFFSVLYAPSPMPLQEAIKRFSNIFFKRERAYMREKWLGR